MQRRLASDALEGPLTDYESSESEGEEDWEDWDTETSSGESGREQPQPQPMTRKARKKARSKRQRNEKRKEAQAAEGAGAEKAVVKKRRLESTQDAIQVGYNLEEDASVAASGWIGKASKKLPLENPLLCELIEKEDLAYFPWDGPYAACFKWVF